MLILTRRIQEKIIIDDEIIVTVLEVGEGKARLGIIAQKDISIRRAESKVPADKKK